MTSSRALVGVLALQGDFERHLLVLNSIGVKGKLVRHAEDFRELDGLIIPGGESTTISDLLVRLDLRQPFTDFVGRKPVWGTCAGMILLGRTVTDRSIEPYDAIDISVERNGYGRQLFSTVRQTSFTVNGSPQTMRLVYIRAPRVVRVGDGVITLLMDRDDPVLLRQRNVLVSSFHPELSGSSFLHHYFVKEFVNRK
jgi:5'-phosphate synthase pdxT subunit